MRCWAESQSWHRRSSISKRWAHEMPASLDWEQGDLVLLLECVSYDASGQAIEYVKSFNRGDTGGYTYTY